MARAKQKEHKSRELVLGYMERISSKVFSDFPKELTDLVGQQHGVYALYKGDRLYYVGLATNLRSRIKSHLADRHAGKWDKFSLYLVRKADHIKELESLILRIADPTGNLTRGRLRRAENMKARLLANIKKAQGEQILTLLGDKTKLRVRRRRRTRAKKAQRVGREPALADYIDRGFKIRARHKGKQYDARVRNDGTINLRGTIYNSPSTAGKAVTGGSVDGWLLWEFRDEKGEWGKLDELRKRKKKQTRSSTKARKPTLAPYINRSFKIRGTNKGVAYEARVKSDGTINFRGKTFTSPSTAGKAAVGHSVDGWHFWHYKNESGEWVRLNELRKD